MRNVPELPAGLALRIENEVLSLADADTGAVVVSWPFHRILCWGFTANTFQWRAYATAEDEAVHGSDGAVAAEKAAAQTAAELASGAAATPSGSASVKAPGSSAVVAYGVGTAEGRAIEGTLMAAVQALMGKMQSRGIPGDEFGALLGTLTALGEEGYTEHALTAVRQMAVGRAFDARQAVALVSTLGALDPFSKVEAVCVLWSGKALLHPESLPSILCDCFEDDGDRENVLHRLGLAVAADGSVLDAPTPASRRLAAAK